MAGKAERTRSLFLVQKPMLRVCAALAPLVLVSVSLFGWRALALALTGVIFALLTEAAFTLPQGKPVTSAAVVSGMIFALSLPPALPFGMAALGIIVGISLGKMVFGGFGRNIFNPAMVGRCFIYITFPIQMTNQWVLPFAGWGEGFRAWSPAADVLTQATPLVELKSGLSPSLTGLFLGTRAGSLGETSAVLIILAGLFLIATKTAPWRLALSCLVGGAAVSALLGLAGIEAVPPPHMTLLAGSFLFGAFFVVTEPVSGPKTKPGQWIYGLLIGGLVIVLRGFSNFSEGVMFSVLIMNAFVPLLDQSLRRAGMPRDTTK